MSERLVKRRVMHGWLLSFPGRLLNSYQTTIIVLRRSLFFDGQVIDLLEYLNGDEIGALELDSARIVPEGGERFEGFPSGDGYTVTLV